MKVRTPLALVLVATLLVPGVALGAVLGSPDLSAHLADNRVTPGEDTTLGVVVVNSGTVDSGSNANAALNSEVTTARGLTVNLNTGGSPLTVQTPRQAVGSLPEGATDPIQYEVSIDEDASPGTYTLPVRAEYEYTSYISEGDGTRRENSTSESLEVRLRVVDEARFDVVAVEDDAQVGSDGTLNVTVQNTGTEAASDAVVTVQSGSADTTFGAGDSPSQSASRYVDDWDAGENRTLSYTLRTADGADTQPYSFDLSVAFEDTDGVSREDTGNSFGVTPDPEHSFALGEVESDLAVGEDGTVDVELENEGDQPVDNVVLQWTGESETISVTEREYAVGDLGPGESSTATFEVEVSESAREGQRQFTFVANYRDADGDQRASDTLEASQTVGPASDVFDVSVRTSTVSAGGAGTLEVQITNARDERVTDVSAKLFADSPISTTDDEAYVQSLGPGESETLRFGIGAAGGALEKDYPVSLDFRYEDADGDTELSDTYRLPVTVEEPENGGGLPVVPIVAVVLVLVAAGAYYRYQR
jgi:hypothetical protein